ncbi:HlyD family efflux transporter periplasmic adaptor subunit [Chroococcidiopsis sp. TS-821]|uniref:HlyD family efflux transporter periplasmic adaptor subunit n=1 Tax=Chroococcidiopsis sp. TS-821 TaxID=1378066 RepID=UPI000D46C6BB|nr:HlyD family efflux transporter periplasmic adaptor subunit [Chroococcidiopsis sp. TS-821]PPS41461.1 HlyD family secretion protein [Chroococcidiopsis sp. TS-821]
MRLTYSEPNLLDLRHHLSQKIGNYDNYTRTRSTYYTTSCTSTATSTTNGTDKNILIKENQEVRRGDAIATLDSSRLQTQRRQLQTNIQQNQRQLERIAAQIKALDAQQNSESNLISRNIAAAQADLSLNQRGYKDQLVVSQAEVQEAEAAVELASEEMKRYQQLANTGAIATLQVKEKEQAFKVALARLSRAKAALNPSNASVTIANERIAQERARGLATLATLNKEREQLLQRQVEIQNQLERDEEELRQLGIELGRTIIIAPVAGTILKLNLRNPGQVVSLGDAIAQIAPSDAPIVIKARVAAEDIAKVSICEQAQILNCNEGKVQLRFSAYPYPDYGTLRGVVRAIAPDVIVSENNGVTAAPYYEVTIQPERPYFVRGEQSYPIQPGMEAIADIISREETVLTFLLRKARLLVDF